MAKNRVKPFKYGESRAMYFWPDDAEVGKCGSSTLAYRPKLCIFFRGKAEKN